MTVVLTFILFFAFALVLIWLWTRKKASHGQFGPTSKVTFPVNVSSGTIGKTGMHTRIVFNGHEYSSPEEMPAEIRQVYERTMATVLVDADHDGVPDIFEPGAITTVFQTDVQTRTLEDPTEKLRKLKEMKDSGLITEQDYESKKSEILNRM
ncbi:MAG TPA: SHOCT domain-containing protein [Pyrinomonadaceae bacterium]